MDTNTILSDLQRTLDVMPIRNDDEARYKLTCQSALGLLGNALGDLKRIADAQETLARIESDEHDIRNEARRG